MAHILVGEDPRLHCVYVRRDDPRRPDMQGMIYVPTEVRQNVLSGFCWDPKHGGGKGRMFGPVRIHGERLAEWWEKDNQKTELLKMNADANNIDLTKITGPG